MSILSRSTHKPVVDGGKVVIFKDFDRCIVIAAVCVCVYVSIYTSMCVSELLFLLIRARGSGDARGEYEKSRAMRNDMRHCNGSLRRAFFALEMLLAAMRLVRVARGERVGDRHAVINSLFILVVRKLKI